MRHVIPTGTDVATICFFAPAALPADFDERVKDDTLETFNALAKEGRLWSQETGSDGGFLLHFYVGEVVPEEIVTRFPDQTVVERFRVPSGVLWACGAEYAANDPAKTLLKFEHMGGNCHIPAGDYRLALWRTEWTDGEIENAIQKKVGKRVLKVTQFLEVSVGVGFFVLLAATATAVLTSISPKGRSEFGLAGLGWFWGILVSTWVVWFGMITWTARVERSPARREVLREFPDYMVQMEKLA